MIDPEEYICPIRRDRPCHKKCAWLVEAEVEADEYLAKDYFCAINLIASAFANEKYIEEEI